jgi:hypothetical protein
VLKHCAANKKRRLSALLNLGSYIYKTLKFLALKELLTYTTFGGEVLKTCGTNPKRGKRFSFLQNVQTDYGAHPPSYYEIRDFFLGEKGARCEVDH